MNSNPLKLVNGDEPIKDTDYSVTITKTKVIKLTIDAATIKQAEAIALEVAEAGGYSAECVLDETVKCSTEVIRWRGQ